MNKPTLCLAMLIAFATAGALAQDAVYKWVDEDGNVHYSSTPPPADVEGELVDASQSRRTPSQRRDAERRSPQQGGSNAAPDAPDAATAQDQQRAQAEEERIRRQRQEACRTARTNLQVMRNNSRVYELDANGQRGYISNEEREARMAAYQRDVDEYCQ